MRARVPCTASAVAAALADADAGEALGSVDAAGSGRRGEVTVSLSVCWPQRMRTRNHVAGKMAIGPSSRASRTTTRSTGLGAPAIMSGTRG
jgi:hypothetical protein